jgi:hypothetical protein
LQELEEFVVQKLCEVVTERCELGDARQRCQLLEQMVEQWRRKAQQLQKQVIYLLVYCPVHKNVLVKLIALDGIAAEEEFSTSDSVTQP